LNNTYGNTVAHVEGFRYSPAMREARDSGMVWDEETLAGYLADPRGFIRGNRMAFQGLRSDEDIAAVIAYIRSPARSDDGRARISAVLSACVSATSVAAEGDPERGAILYRPCGTCHMIGDGAIHRIGPHLNNLVGRGIGAVEGYDFSGCVRGGGGEQGDVWTEAALDGFIANPDGYLPGTSMVFRGIRAAEDRADLISFLYKKAVRRTLERKPGPTPEVAAILAIEGDVAYGQYLSSECTSCHIGEGGEDIPSIRGLSPTSSSPGMAAYRSGERQHQVMNTLAGRLG
jgi:cytochrome c